MRKYLGIFVLALLMLGCVSRSVPLGTAWGSGAFASNGERIYFTSTSERGGAITYTGGPDVGGMMMGGSMTCASCHGPTGRGGRHIMHMEVMNASDIRWPALISESGEGHGDGGEDGDHPTEYGLEEFRLAVVEGKHPDGKRLKADMPRWKMSEEDLNDLLSYLKTTR